MNRSHTSISTRRISVYESLEYLLLSIGFGYLVTDRDSAVKKDTKWLLKFFPQRSEIIKDIG